MTQDARRSARTGTADDLIRLIADMDIRIANLERHQTFRLRGPIVLAAVDLGGAPPVYRIELRNEATGDIEVLATI